jgi:hypothetical protein
MDSQPGVGAVDASAQPAGPLRPDATLTRPSRRPKPAPTVLPVTDTQRVIAIGDVHGDLAAVKSVLRLAEVIDGDDRWSGEDAVVVQVGDQLDRGNGEQAIVDLFEKLSDEAWAAGGGLFPLIGNHETMNVSLNFGYVTAGGWADFADIAYDENDSQLNLYPASQRGRVAAMRPGGVYARIFAEHNMVMIVGGTLFVHGGLLPQHLVIGLDEMNRQVQSWMRGEGPIPASINSAEGVVWNRVYSSGTSEMDCARLAQVLRLLSVERIVVAHTVQQQGINAACNDTAWRVDVGLASHYGGRPQALEIIGDSVRAIGP